MVRALYFYEFLGKPSSDVSALSSALCCFSCIVNQFKKGLVMPVGKSYSQGCFLKFCFWLI